MLDLEIDDLRRLVTRVREASATKWDQQLDHDLFVALAWNGRGTREDWLRDAKSNASMSMPSVTCDIDYVVALVENMFPEFSWGVSKGVSIECIDGSHGPYWSHLFCGDHFSLYSIQEKFNNERYKLFYPGPTSTLSLLNGLVSKCLDKKLSDRFIDRTEEWLKRYLVTHTFSNKAADLLLAMDLDPSELISVQVDRDCYEDTKDKLASRVERREGDVVVIVGQHEDHGMTGLVREDGVFTVVAEETAFVRPRGAPVER